MKDLRPGSKAAAPKRKMRRRPVAPARGSFVRNEVDRFLPWLAAMGDSSISTHGLSRA